MNTQIFNEDCFTGYRTTEIMWHLTALNKMLDTFTYSTNIEHTNEDIQNDITYYTVDEIHKNFDYNARIRIAKLIAKS